MKFFKENFAHIVLALIVVILVVVTISLQAMIFLTQSNRGETQEAKGIVHLLRQQWAQWVLPPTDTPVARSLPTPPSHTSTPTPPDTSSLIVIEPTVASTPSAGVSQAPPMNPRLTATLAAVPAPTIVVTASPTFVENDHIDLRLGYVDRADSCPFVTEVVALVLEREFKLRIGRVAYATIEELFAALAATDPAQKVDLTLCYTDPEDRAYLQKHFGFIIFVGGAYRIVDAKRYLIVSNAPVKGHIERKEPCLYRLLNKLNFGEDDLSGQDALAWYDNHLDMVQSWTQCE